MNIVPRFSINRRPKDLTNLSLVKSNNVYLNENTGTLSNEKSTELNIHILNNLISHYGNVNNYKIVGAIPCSKELVIIVKDNRHNNKADVFRFNEETNILKLSYGGHNTNNYLHYYGGLIKGTFTYNVEGSLIIAISEYNVPGLKLPLKTINLGNFDDDTVYSDKNITDDSLRIAPKVELPVIKNTSYLTGNSSKGWYYPFIRYKLNSVDYSQWYPIGSAIYVDSISAKQIVRYCYNNMRNFRNNNKLANPIYPDDGYGAGFSDAFSDIKDNADETFKFDIHFPIDTVYDTYQIGFICTSKTYTRGFITDDISLTNFIINNNFKIKNYIFDSKTSIDHPVADFIVDNYNYYNVKNIINYNNRLYISNYLEHNLNDKTITKSMIDGINVGLNIDSIEDKGLFYDSILYSGKFENEILTNHSGNQYDTYYHDKINLSNYVNYTGPITVSSGSINITDNADQFWIERRGDSYAFIRYVGHLQYVAIGNTANNTAITIRVKDKTIIFNTWENAMQLESDIYVNTATSFDTRRLNSTLIPGEIYNIFIHFVDENGHSTNGYNIQNNIKWTAIGNTAEEIVPVSFSFRNNNIDYNYFAALPVNQNILKNSDNNLVLNLDNITFHSSYDGWNTKNPRLTSSIPDNLYNDVYNAFLSLYNSFVEDKYLNYKWYQISFMNNIPIFGLFINNNGDRLFKVPNIETYNETFNSDTPNNLLGYIYLSRLLNIIKISFSNVIIPDGYVGYFISYEKFEPIGRAVGMLTRNDFRSQDWVGDGNRATANTKKSDKMLFYSESFDNYDTIKFDYNIMNIEGINVYKKEDIKSTPDFKRNRAMKYPRNMNKPQVAPITSSRVLAIPKYKLAVANSVESDRVGLGTALELEDKYELFPDYITTAQQRDMIVLYRVKLYNTNRNIYLSKDKELIKLSDIFYKNNNHNQNSRYSTGYINNGYNGYWSFGGTLVYENAGYVFNDSDKRVRNLISNAEYYKFDLNPDVFPFFRPTLNYPFLAYVQMPICSEHIKEGKSYKNNPMGIMFPVKLGNSEDPTSHRFHPGVLVHPMNSIDLFESRQHSSGEFVPKSYTNFRGDVVSITEHNKTVRRSTVIQDESRVNGWRRFILDSYKNINENKGDITNLLGIGTMFIVHTEHSLFILDVNNMLTTSDNEQQQQGVQLSQLDVFETQYKEVFTSDKGYGGLTDDLSFISDNFGYIFYNNSFNRFYRFDASKLGTIDDDIIMWLDRYKPYNVRFANDKPNNRLIIKMNYNFNNEIKDLVISYNYNTNTFVSSHDYFFERAYNTEFGLYFEFGPFNSFYQYIKTNSSFGKFANIKGNGGKPTIRKSTVGIVLNDNYESIKYLEYINYKLSKYLPLDNRDVTTLPVEEVLTPFAGNSLTVYNDEVNTGKLDISIDDESSKNIFANFDKPYWDLGVWNYSYLRNRITELNNGLSATEMSRIYGNYFIIEFEFDNEDELKVELESLGYNLIRN